MEESKARADEGLKWGLANHRFDTHFLTFGAGVLCMEYAAIPLIRKIFNRVVFQDSAILAADLLEPTVLFLTGWWVMTFQKTIARGLKHYKAIIEKESFDSKIAKEGTALIFDPAWDHNLSFELCFQNATNYEHLSKRFKLISKTAALTPELFNSIHQCADRGNDIKVLELQGHGDPYATRLGKNETEDQNTYFVANELYGYEPELEAALNRLNPNAIILIKSCSAAGKAPANICQTPNTQSKNTAYRIAALANRRKVIASSDISHSFIIRNDPASTDQGLNVKILDAFRNNLTVHIQENDQNTHEFEAIRSAIYAARAQVDIEKAVLELKEKERYGESDPIHISVSCSEKNKKYFQYTLQGLLKNRVGVESVDYIESTGDATTYKILGEPTKFSILKNKNSANIAAKFANPAEKTINSNQK
jgi:hypothetical protein